MDRLAVNGTDKVCAWCGKGGRLLLYRYKNAEGNWSENAYCNNNCFNHITSRSADRTDVADPIVRQYRMNLARQARTRRQRAG